MFFFWGGHPKFFSLLRGSDVRRIVLNVSVYQPTVMRVWVCKGPLNPALFSNLHVFEWVRDAGNRKKNQPISRISPCTASPWHFFSFPFSFQLPLRTALTEAQRFDLTMSKCKEVKWNDENNLIHAWATWGSAFTHRHTARAHTLELSSTSRFTLIWAEGLEPEWAGPVVSVCQSRWTLDPLSASPAKQTTCLFSPAPNFPLDVFCHVGDLAHLQYFLHCLWDINLIKTVLLVWIDFSVLVILFFFFFAFQTSVNPSWHRGEQQQDFYSCVKVEQLFVFFCSWSESSVR